MTPHPHTINADLSLAKPKQMMCDLGVRHLPVLSAGKVLGLISDRDLNLMSGFRDVDVHNTTVEQAMTEKPYVVDAEALLDQVTTTMAEEKYGSAIVTQNHKVVGIFTAVDAMRAL